jgi:hypothetical protein
MKAHGVHSLGSALALALVLVLLLAGSAAHGQGEEYSLSWGTMTGGGASSGGDYTMVATVAQPEVSTATSGGDYTLVGGVWGSPIAPRFVIYLPLVLRN